MMIPLFSPLDDGDTDPNHHSTAHISEEQPTHLIVMKKMMEIGMGMLYPPWGLRHCAAEAKDEDSIAAAGVGEGEKRTCSWDHFSAC